MGWELMHLFSYQDGRGCGGQISSDSRLSDVCRVGDALTYTYDFGDSWQHLVTVEKAMAKPTGTYPRVVAVDLPTERSRWAVRLWDMLKVLGGQRNTHRHELLDRLGGAFDPKAFNIDKAGSV